MTSWEKLKVYKVIRIYLVPASSKKAALDAMREPNHNDEFFQTEFAVEVTAKGWFGMLLKQILG
jgi:hypothetical protein